MLESWNIELTKVAVTLKIDPKPYLAHHSNIPLIHYSNAD